MDEETRRHKETVLTLNKKDRKIKEGRMQVQEEQAAVLMAEDTVAKLTEKLNIFKRQIAEAVSLKFLLEFSSFFAITFFLCRKA